MVDTATAPSSGLGAEATPARPKTPVRREEPGETRGTSRAASSTMRPPPRQSLEHNR